MGRLGVFVVVLFGACDAPPPAATTQPPRLTTVASLVPAATDMILAMGAADQLVAISNFDTERDSIRDLPRVGDYQNTDWEKLARLRPDVMIVQLGADRMPAGLSQRADQLNIRLVNVTNNQLADVFDTMRQIGQAIGQEASAEQAAAKLRRQLDAVRARVADRAPVSALIVLDDTGQSVAGPGTFLHDLLELAGGRNVAGHLSVPYPSVDRETLLALRPRVILQLLPGASPQVKQQAGRFWKQLDTIPAVCDGRVHVLDDWYVLLPGAHVGDVAERFADLLH